MGAATATALGALMLPLEAASAGGGDCDASVCTTAAAADAAGADESATTNGTATLVPPAAAPAPATAASAPAAAALPPLSLPLAATTTATVAAAAAAATVAELAPTGALVGLGVASVGSGCTQYALSATIQSTSASSDGALNVNTFGALENEKKLVFGCESCSAQSPVAGASETLASCRFNENEGSVSVASSK